MTKILVLGGVRSGKSGLAERLAALDSRVCYLATASAGDQEMAERIRRHRARRPADWALVEEPVALGRVMAERADDAPTLLVDCMSLWLGQLLAAGDDAVFQRERHAFVDAVPAYPGGVVIVSNEVGLGTIGMDPLTRRFADELGWLNQDLAQHCDTVVLTVAGLPQVLKGELPDELVRG